jgi:hypothetical protein
MPAASAEAPITRIVASDCRFGNDRPGAPPLRAIVLTPDGRALRAKTLDDPGAPQKHVLYERAQLAAPAFQRVSGLIASSSFFEPSRSRGGSMVGVIVSDTRGTRVSAQRGSARVTWSSADYPPSRGTMIEKILRAVLDVSTDARLTWTGARAPAEDPFSICRDAVEIQEPRIEP